MTDATESAPVRSELLPSPILSSLLINVSVQAPESYSSKEKEQRDQDEEEEGKATAKQKRDHHVDHSFSTVLVSCATTSLEAAQAARCTGQGEPRLGVGGLEKNG